jgi:hypothetical protein
MAEVQKTDGGAAQAHKDDVHCASPVATSTHACPALQSSEETQPKKKVAVTIVVVGSLSIVLVGSLSREVVGTPVGVVPSPNTTTIVPSVTVSMPEMALMSATKLLNKEPSSIAVLKEF